MKDMMFHHVNFSLRELPRNKMWRILSRWIISTRIKISRLGTIQVVTKITSDPTKVDITTIHRTIKATRTINKVQEFKVKFLTNHKQFLKDLQGTQIRGTTKGFKKIKATVRKIIGVIHPKDNNRVLISRNIKPLELHLLDSRKQLQLKLDHHLHQHLQWITLPCYSN